MSDPLYELLEPHLDANSEVPDASSRLSSNYLHRITTLSLSSLRDTEQEALDHDSLSLLRSIQALSKRSYKSIDLSINALSKLRENIPQITQNANELQSAIPNLESNALSFAEKYSKLTDNAVLDRRKRVLRLGDNVDRLADILEMPALLSGTIAASASTASGTATGAASSINSSYTAALDLYAHIRRLKKLYPDSALVQSILLQSEEAMRAMTTNLIASLRSQSLKLASAMRFIGLLRRVTPDLDDVLNSGKAWTSGMGEGSLGVIFLVCRLYTLTTTLEALEPLRELADQESGQGNKVKDKSAWAAGQQTERYLKRYVEVFREQCFSIISMYKSIFPTSLPVPISGDPSEESNAKSRPSNLRSTSGLRDNEVELPDDPMQRLPAALSTFTLHIVDLLMETLKAYMPNIRDQSSRDSLLTQVLYCAASLGRLGGDFSMALSMLEDELSGTSELYNEESLTAGSSPNEPEWAQAMKKHRIQAGRLETLASGAGRQANKEIQSHG